MDASQLQLVSNYVNEHIDTFHTNRFEKLRKLKLLNVLKRKNPYLFKAKNIQSAPELVASILDAFLSSSEEEQFGRFLEHLAIYVAELTCGGQKSSTTGIDLEFTRNNVRYIVAIKSGPNWGNSGQYANLRASFKAALKVLKQNTGIAHAEAVLGTCYGKFRPVHNGAYLKIGGQCFWYFISEDANLYTDIIEPLGYEARRHNDNYLQEKTNVYNRFAGEFITHFCLPSGEIDWPKLVQFNSGNLNKKAHALMNM